MFDIFYNIIIFLNAYIFLVLCSYSLIAWTASAHKGPIHLVDYALRDKTTSNNVLNFFSAMGNVAFAFAGHNVVLEIQANYSFNPRKPL